MPEAVLPPPPDESDEGKRDERSFSGRTLTAYFLFMKENRPHLNLDEVSVACGLFLRVRMAGKCFGGGLFHIVGKKWVERSM
eukprot:1136257-Amorphochlora_amoeboformis.AAC.1